MSRRYIPQGVKGLIVASLCAGMFVVPRTLSACTVELIWRKMPGTFRIVVDDHDEPVSGLSVLIRRSEDGSANTEVRKGFTSSDGSFEVEGLPPGKYDVSVGAETALAGGAFVEVMDRSPWRLPKLLRIPWTSERVLSVRHFRGALAWSGPTETEPTKPMGAGVLTIKEARSGEAVAVITSTPEGEFDAGDLPEGLYAVSVRARPNMTRPPTMPLSMWERIWWDETLPVWITKDQGAADRVKLQISYTSCGMEFAVQTPK